MKGLMKELETTEAMLEELHKVLRAVRRTAAFLESRDAKHRASPESSAT